MTASIWSSPGSPASVPATVGAQAGVEINETTVADYAADMASGAGFPPVVVYFDGTDYWLADGFHRVRAATRIARRWWCWCLPGRWRCGAPEGSHADAGTPFSHAMRTI